MKDQPTEEVKSLAGKNDKTAMGKNISRSKPKKEKLKKKDSAPEPKWELKGGNILSEKFD